MCLGDAVADRELESLEDLLYHVARGDETCRRSLLLRLCDTLLFTPILRSSGVASEASSDSRMILAASFHSKGQKYVPVFTSGDYLSDWSVDMGKDYRRFCVAGADLALALPEDTWLAVNPGQTFVALPPCDVRKLAQLGHNLFCEEAEPLGCEEEGPVEPELSREESRRRDLDVEFKAFVLEAELRFQDFSDLLSAYASKAPSERFACVLGLVLTETIEASKRFALVDWIAETSRRFFGKAGAVDVYYDLADPGSPAWEHFSGAEPFYRRPGVESIPAEGASEGEVTDGGEAAPAAQSEEVAPEKKGLRSILKALRFGLRH